MMNLRRPLAVLLFATCMFLAFLGWRSGRAYEAAEPKLPEIIIELPARSLDRHALMLASREAGAASAVALPSARGIELRLTAKDPAAVITALPESCRARAIAISGTWRVMNQQTEVDHGQLP